MRRMDPKNELGHLSEAHKVQLSMNKEKNRLATFKNWIFLDDQPCSAAKMAEAGFYSVATKDEPDAVQCFVCSKTLDGWDKDDDPWKEHLSHAKSCAFAKLQKQEKDLTTLELAELHKTQQINVYSKHFNDIVEERNELWDELIENVKNNINKK